MGADVPLSIVMHACVRLHTWPNVASNPATAVLLLSFVVFLVVLVFFVFFIFLSFLCNHDRRCDSCAVHCDRLVCPGLAQTSRMRLVVLVHFAVL